MMNVFWRKCFVSVVGMVLVGGMSTACADGGEKQADDKAVTAETRKQIVKTLLDVARDKEAKVEVRVSAMRSLGRASVMNAVKAEVRETLVKIVETKDAAPGLQLAAIAALRESDVKLTEADLTVIGEALWSALTENDGSNDQERFLRGASAWEIARYVGSDKPISGPKHLEGVQALLEMSVNSDQFRVSDEDGSIPSSRLADFALATLTDSEDGVRVLIEVLADLDGKFNAKREKIASLIKHTVPKTEGIAQLLLKAASHENPDIRAAAIEALGNEIPENDPGATLISPAVPE